MTEEFKAERKAVRTEAALQISNLRAMFEQIAEQITHNLSVQVDQKAPRQRLAGDVGRIEGYLEELSDPLKTTL